MKRWFCQVRATRLDGGNVLRAQKHMCATSTREEMDFSFARRKNTAAHGANGVKELCARQASKAAEVSPNTKLPIWMFSIPFTFYSLSLSLCLDISESYLQSSEKFPPFFDSDVLRSSHGFLCFLIDTCDPQQTRRRGAVRTWVTSFLFHPFLSFLSFPSARLARGPGGLLGFLGSTEVWDWVEGMRCGIGMGRAKKFMRRLRWRWVVISRGGVENIEVASCEWGDVVIR